MGKFPSVVIGGTFDHIHIGHEALLHKAFEVGDHVLIGLTSEKYMRRYKNLELKSQKSKLKIENFKLKIREYEIRKKQLSEWLDSHGYLEKASIVPIDDPWGPLLKRDHQIEAIVVSVETRRRAEELNRLREKNRVPPLTIIEIPVVINRNDEVQVSSTNIRKGIMDEGGNLILPEKFRTMMREPLGPVIKDTETDALLDTDRGKMIIAVGDRTTERMLSVGLIPTLSAIDLQVERKKVVWEKTMFDLLTKNAAIYELVSGPGYVSRRAREIVKQWKDEGFPRTVLLIDGEEDLLVLPLLTEAPMGSILYYGQPAPTHELSDRGKPVSLDNSRTSNQCGPASPDNPYSTSQGGPGAGLVRVIVDDQVKEKARDLLEHFER